MIILACAPGEKLPGGFIDEHEFGWLIDCLVKALCHALTSRIF